MIYEHIMGGGGMRPSADRRCSHERGHQFSTVGTDRLHTALLHENKRRRRVCGLSIGEVGIRCPAICRADDNYRLAHISGLLQDGIKRHCFYKCWSSNNLWHNCNSHKYLWNFRKYVGHFDIPITVNMGAVA